VVAAAFHQGETAEEFVYLFSPNSPPLFLVLCRFSEFLLEHQQSLFAPCPFFTGSGPSSYTFLPVGEKENPLMLAAYGGCALTRLSARRAFKEKGRSMLAYDLVDFIGPNFADHFEAESYSSSTYSSSISK